MSEGTVTPHCPAGRPATLGSVVASATLLKIDDAADRDTIERVHGFHAVHCPVARSIRGAIDVSTELMRLIGLVQMIGLLRWV